MWVCFSNINPTKIIKFDRFVIFVTQDENL